MKILIIDDNAENLYMLETLLKGNGYEVVSAANGKEALEKLRSEGAGMIISDILMPVMDGFQLCQEVGADETLRHIPFIFYTATYTNEKDEAFALKIGADKFLRKPMEPDEFIRIIQGVIRDMEEGKLRPQKPALKKTEETFQLYSERLVKKLEKKMLDLEKEIVERERVEERVKHLNLVLHAIRKVNQLIVQEKDPERLLQGVCDNLIENLGYYNAWIVLLDDTGRSVATAEAGLGKDFLPIVERLKKGKLIDCVKKAQMQSEIVIIKDTPSTCTDCPLAKRYCDRGGFCARLEHDEKMYGLLTVSIPGCFATDGEEQALFGDVAGDIGYALHNIEIEKARRKAEEALRESEERYRTLFEDSKDAIYIVQAKGEFIDVNQAMTELFGYTKEEMIKINIKEIYKNPKDQPGILDELDQKGALKDYEIKFKKKDGKEIDCLITVTAKKDYDGNIIGYQGIIRDITEYKALEAQFVQSQKMEAIGTLAGGVAHDFNNLLTCIIGNADMTLMGLDKDGPAYKEIDEIKKAGERASQLTRQLLAFSRKEVIIPELLNLNDVLKGVENMLGRLIREDIELKLIPCFRSCPMNADPGQIEQVILNLAVNAMDAMPRGGKLVIQTTNMDLDMNYFRKHLVEADPGPYVMLSISDTGVGMDEETRSRMFEPFFTTKEKGKGTGLGLSTVYGIVKQNSGFIWAYSEPGQGTTMNIYFPAADNDAESMKREAVAKGEPIGSETILIVEDDDLVQEIARMALHRYGYRILEAKNGEEALSVGEAHEGPIHLLLTDVVMPGMGGRELADRIMSMRPEIRVLYMSGYADEATFHQGIQSPGVNFIGKPFAPVGLARKVREVLGS